MVDEVEHEFPMWMSFLLNNPIRRYFNPPQKIVKLLDVKSGDVVLDFGSGPGFYTIPLAKIAKKVVAIDKQPQMLEKIVKYAGKQSVTVQSLVSDGEKIDLPSETFDLIFLSHVYHEIKKKISVLNELRRLLKPAGRLVIMEHTKRGLLPGPPAMNLGKIQRELEAQGFAVKTIYLKNLGLVVAQATA